jgi:hypothetical protein
MRNPSVRKGIIQAHKVGTLSLSAWQIGMYAYRASLFLIFRAVLHIRLEVNNQEFWFMMQIAVLDLPAAIQ